MNNEELVWITKVEKKGTKYLVYTSLEEEPLKLTEDVIINYRIMKGNSYTLNDYKKIKKETSEGLIFDSILGFIDFKMRTEKEVIDKLNEKTTDEKVIKRIIKRLKDLKLIDDDRYAKLYIEQEVRKLNGPKFIKYSLSLKGIKEELSDKYLIQIEEKTWKNNAEELANKSLVSLKGEPVNKQKETLYNKLMAKGYSSSIINQVLNSIKYNELDHDKLEKLFKKLQEKETDKNKIITKLLSKGYDYQDIKRLFQLQNSTDLD